MRMRRSRTVGVAILLVAIAGCDVGPTDPGEVSLAVPGADVGGGSTGSMAAVHPDLTVSDLEDGVDLEQAARRWIGHAQRLFDRASELAGPNPEPLISAWIQAAEQLLDQAKESYAAGHFPAAIAQAQASAQKSQDVIEALSGDRTNLEDRAVQAIQHAEALYREAVDLAGPNPERRVRTALGKAQDLLEAAVRAFEAEEYQQAIRHALDSAHISQTVIRYLTS
jgi:HEPN domain-containing protein